MPASRARGASAGTAHTFQVRAKNAGGIDASPAAYTWTVDTVKLELSLTSSTTKSERRRERASFALRRR